MVCGLRKLEPAGFPTVLKLVENGGSPKPGKYVDGITPHHRLYTILL